MQNTRDVELSNSVVSTAQASSESRLRDTVAESDFLSHLARELHDGVVQNIWYLQNELGSISTRAAVDVDNLRDELQRLTSIAQDTYDELRTTLDVLHEKNSERICLKSDLAHVASKFSAATHMDVEFRCVGASSDFEIDGHSGKHVKRLVQEALWNSYQHSLGGKAEISLDKSKGSLVIMVSDNGRGFDTEKVETNHYGLRTMRERAEAINGNLFLSSRSGEGTTVTLQFAA